MKYKFGLLLLAGVFALAACNKEEDPFAGKDSYITAFSLRQGELVFHAAIAGDEITITVPEGFSLMQAKATVRLSENATIYPDPATVTAWDEEQAFAVTAHNGAQTKYKYTVTHGGLSYEGTVALYTQADVDAFGQQGITLLDGSLTLGRPTGTDSITSLAPLAALKEVAYNITLNPTCAITGLEGLEALEYVGGTLQIGALPHLETLALHTLKSAGAVALQNTATIVVELPGLADVSKQLSLNCPLFQLQLPSLQRVGGTLTLTTSSASMTSLNKVSLPALEEAGGIAISAFPIVARIDLPQLKKSADLRCTSMSKLSLIYAPLLEEVTGQVYLLSLTALPELELPELKQAGGIEVQSCGVLHVLTFPKITDIATLYFYGSPVEGITGFSSLQSAGTITWYDPVHAPKLELPASLQHVKSLLMINMSNMPPEEMNVAGTTIDVLTIQRNALKVGKLVGDEEFHGTLVIYPESATAPFPAIPLLEGFSVVDSLSMQSQGTDSLIVPGIRKINRGAYFRTSYSGNPRHFALPDLEEVGGTLNIDFPYMSATTVTTTLKVEKLQRVGGDFTMNAMISNSQQSLALQNIALNFPELTAVDGNFNLTTGYDYTYRIGFEMLNFPKLARVGKKLTIHSGSTYYINQKVKNLDGFAALTSVGSIEVTRQDVLVDYTGLKELFKTLPEEKWITPTNNGYNPSWQDLKDGKWTK